MREELSRPALAEAAPHLGLCVDRTGDFDVIACGRCGFRHVLPLPTADALAHAYQHEYYAVEKPLYLEGTRRGVYAGALGYVGFDGSLDTCIALRTIVMRDGVALLQAGAGIVADSDPASEHVECMNKLAALSAAIDLAETGRYGR